MTRVYFVRHAEPDHDWEDDRTRPLTEEGQKDTSKVLDFLKDKEVERFYCSPYLRSLETIRSTADYYGKEIITLDGLREREHTFGSNTKEMLKKRWENLDFHEAGGESIQMVQDRNMLALHSILKENEGCTIVIGTHGTALSSILRYYDESFGFDDFIRIIDWMPYIIELDFDGIQLLRKVEHLHISKVFRAKSR